MSTADENAATILVVDDNEGSRYATARILKNAGFIMREAGTLAACMEQVIKSQPDLLVLDVNLPDGNGIEMCRALKSRHETKSMPIVHVSASSIGSAERVRGLDTGADAYITEPYEPAVLVSTIKALLRTREAENRVRRILSSITEGYLQLDPAWRVVDINPVFEKVVGRTYAQVKGKDFWGELSSLKGTAFQAEFQKAVAEQKPVHFEGFIPQKNAWFEVHGYPNEKGLEVYLRDISTRKHAEEERIALIAREQEARKQAEAANSAKDRFLAVLSHELRTPLNTILGWTQLMRDGAMSPADTSKALDVMYRNAQAQRQLIEDLIDISRIVSGKLSVELAPVKVETAVTAAVDNIRPTAVTKGVEVTLASTQETGVQIMADSARIQQVLSNLLSNSLKFTPKGGSITIHLAGGAGRVTITIKDTGKGIDPKFLPRIFERFQQEDTSSTRRYTGLGLGLAITRTLVDLHGGSIRVLSDGEGKGTTVILDFPVLKAPVEPPRAAAKPPARSNHRFVIVDDDADGSEPLTIILRARGVHVDYFASATDALHELPRLAPPTVVISDIAMPQIDGIEFIQRLRKLPGYEQMPAIAVSAYATEGYVEKCLAAGFNLYLAKPAGADALIKAVDSLIAV